MKSYKQNALKFHYRAVTKFFSISSLTEYTNNYMQPPPLLKGMYHKKSTFFTPSLTKYRNNYTLNIFSALIILERDIPPGPHIKRVEWNDNQYILEVTPPI